MFRGYDPVLGRMNGVDVMASKFGCVSPYSYAFNNPMVFNDPNGDAPLYSESERMMFGAQMVGGVIKDNGVFGQGGFFQTGWAPGSGSVMASVFKAQDERIFLAQASEKLKKDREKAKDNSGVATINFLAMQNGVTYGYNLITTAAGALISVTRSLVTQSSNGGWIARGLSLSVDLEMSNRFSPGSTQGEIPPTELKDLAAVLFITEASLFNIEAYAEFGLARNEAMRAATTRATGYYWNPGRLRGSDKFLKGLKVMGGTLAKFTFWGGVATSVAGVVQNPTLENASWAAADISVGLIGLNATAIAGALTTAGLAVPGLNLIIAGGALIYSGYRLYQAFNED